MTIYEWLRHMAKTRADALAVDLELGTLHYNGDCIIDRHGQHIYDVCLEDGYPVTLTGIVDYVGNPYEEIERLYTQFKRSVPGKQERLNKGAFKALSSDLLSFDELANNMPRMEARLHLEGFILLGALSGLIPWHNPKHFFWRGADPELIVYRSWIMKEYNNEQIRGQSHQGDTHTARG